MLPKHANELMKEVYRLGYTPRGKEKKFLDSVKSYIDSDRRLTPPMAKWLNDLYRKAAGGCDYQNRNYV